jgi:hypothetical protein
VVLRAEADALTKQLKSSMATLADLRRELLEMPATTISDNSRAVPLNELLQYAKNIAKYTVPPTYRERIPTLPTADPDKAAEGNTGGPASNGTGTPAQATPKDDANGDREAIVAADVTAEWLKKLNESQVPWQPWPDNDKIRRGNLMQIQYLIDTKQDPTKVDATKLDREVKEKIVADAAEMQAAAQAAAQTQAQADQPVQNVPPPAAPGPSRPPAETFAGFDFAAEDDDDN